MLCGIEIQIEDMSTETIKKREKNINVDGERGRGGEEGEKFTQRNVNY